MGLKGPRKNIVDRFARAHGHGAHENSFAALRPGIAAIECRGNVVDPFFFFGTVREHQFERAARGGRLGFRRGGRRVPANREQKNQESAKQKKSGREKQYERAAGSRMGGLLARPVRKLSNKASR